MARSNFRVEQGIEILEANGTSGIWLLQGAGAPAGTSGPTDDAPIGSFWHDNANTGEVYHKKASTSSASDWERLANETVYSLFGSDVDFNDTTMDDASSYTGNILTANTIKGNLQELSDAVESIAGGSESDDDIGAATPTTVNTCLVDNCNFVEWEVQVFEQVDKTKREAFKVTALHNGTPSTDADAFDESVHTKLKNASSTIAGLTYTTKLTGATTAQTIGLEISATAAITVLTRRTALAAD